MLNKYMYASLLVFGILLTLAIDSLVKRCALATVASHVIRTRRAVQARIRRALIDINYKNVTSQSVQ